MRDRLDGLVLFVPLMTICLTASMPAADSCQPILDALKKVATTASHSYTSSTDVNGGKPTEAETIFANGQKCPQFARIRILGKGDAPAPRDTRSSTYGEFGIAAEMTQSSS
jgi:hypothetical protein